MKIFVSKLENSLLKMGILKSRFISVVVVGHWKGSEFVPDKLSYGNPLSGSKAKPSRILKA